jgi:hypothetical protein
MASVVAGEVVAAVPVPVDGSLAQAPSRAAMISDAHTTLVRGVTGVGR